MASSVRALLAAIVDYAGLFPPAQLSLLQSGETYARERMGIHDWMLGRFVLPAARVAELTENLAPFPGAQSWPLSVVLSGELESVMEQMRSLQFTSDQLTIAALEFPPLPVNAIASLQPHLPETIDAFFEVPFSDPIPHLEAFKGTRLWAKIRTGGIRAEAFPSVPQLGQFILACANAQVPFKATAGLHHALPGHYRLTYEPDSPTGSMHGFLNVAIAASFAYSQTITLEEIAAILTEPLVSMDLSQEKPAPESEGFVFQTDGLKWGDRHLSLSTIRASRQDFFRGFGSCSFQEPIHDLMTLQVLKP